jgi:hypothetical protein
VDLPQEGSVVPQECGKPIATHVPMAADCVESENSSARLSKVWHGVTRLLRNKGHYIISCLLAIASIPGFKAAGLHLSINWQRLIPMYWVGLGTRSILAAAILAVIGLPSKIVVKPVWEHFAAQKPRLIIFGSFVVWVFWKFGIYLGLVWIAVALVSTEIYDRSEGKLLRVAMPLGSVILPAMYLFAGLIIVFVYNHLIVSIRDPGGYDWLFLKMDSYLLHGGTISDLARKASLRLSPRTFAFAEIVYYRMFDQVGAAILLVSVCQGVKRGLRLVGTMLTTYFIALLVFYLWPSMGPFYTCPDHFGHFPQWLVTYGSQQNLISNVKFMSGQYRALGQINTDYFIAFPSLHIALPIIVLWFMRRWKRIVWFLVVYDIVLIPAILLLEWHYVVDLIGGAAVAVIGIWINDPSERAAIREQRDVSALPTLLKDEPQPVLASSFPSQ